MSNIVSIQFTRFQDLNSSGEPVGYSSLGYRIYDDYMQNYNNSFESMREMLNAGLTENRIFDYIAENHDDFDMVAREKGVILNGNYIEPPKASTSGSEN